MTPRGPRRGAAFRVLIATDGSPSARAAVATARAFPWPRGSRMRGVVVSPLDWQGAPLPGLLEAVDRTDASLLVVGARATSGVKRALLGSVAVGVLNRSSVPVLVVR